MGHFQTYDVTDGLGGSLVYSILQDRNGFLWFGLVGKGISRYDGHTFRTFTQEDGLPACSVSRIFEDSAGNLWFGTNELDTLKGAGVCKYDGVTFRTYTTADGLADDTVTAIYEDHQGHLWFGTMNGVSEFDGATFRNYTPEDGFPSAPSVLESLGDERSVFVEAITQDQEGNFWFGKRLQTQRAIAQQFNPYIAGRVVGSDLFYGRSDLITDIERTLANNCFLLYGERRIGKTSLQHQLRERLQNADDPTYRFIPAYIDLQGVVEEDFFRTIAAGVVEHATSLFGDPLPLRLNEDRDRYTYRDLNRDLRTILNHLKEGETRTIKLVLLMDEVDTLNTYSLRTNLNLRGLFMGPFKENLVLVMSGLYLKTDWSDEGAGSPPSNFLSREIQLEPLNQEDARKLITEPVRGFYSYEPEVVELILSMSELRPFTIQAFCLRAVNRILADGRTKITTADIKAIKNSVLAEVASIRGERAGTSLPASLNEALVRLADLEAENKRLREETA